MRSINFNFQNDNEKSSIKYEEYYFNGIPVPKNIQIKNFNCSNLDLSWSIDNINLININTNEINYKVEIKKENENEKYMKVYEGKNQNCSIRNLIKNTNYYLIISLCYNDLLETSLSQKIKTNNFNFNYDSLILNESQKKKNLSKRYLSG